MFSTKYPQLQIFRCLAIEGRRVALLLVRHARQHLRGQHLTLELCLLGHKRVELQLPLILLLLLLLLRLHHELRHLREHSVG